MPTKEGKMKVDFSDRIYARACTSQISMRNLGKKMDSIARKMAGTSTSDPRQSAAFASARASIMDVNKNMLDLVASPAQKDDDEGQPQNVTGHCLNQHKQFLGVRVSSLEPLNESDESDDEEYAFEKIDMDPKFESVFQPEVMRCLALVSHNNMKTSMKQFVLANKNALKKFRLTGTNTTMSMLREVFGDDPEVKYGPSCKSGPLGGDCQLVAMCVTGEVGGCFFFIDPMDAHPHSADIETLVRQGNVYNILMCNNPTTAHVALNAMRIALKLGRIEMMPSFFFDLESPSVPAYRNRQAAILENAKKN